MLGVSRRFGMYHVGRISSLPSYSAVKSGVMLSRAVIPLAHHHKQLDTLPAPVKQDHVRGMSSHFVTSKSVTVTQQLNAHRSRVTVIPLSQEDTLPAPATFLDKQATSGGGYLTVERTKDQLAQMFLPRGFPASVTPNYAPYSAWHFAHLATGTVTGGDDLLPKKISPRSFIACVEACGLGILKFDND